MVTREAVSGSAAWAPPAWATQRSEDFGNVLYEAHVGEVRSESDEPISVDLVQWHVIDMATCPPSVTPEPMHVRVYGLWLPTDAAQDLRGLLDQALRTIAAVSAPVEPG